MVIYWLIAAAGLIVGERLAELYWAERNRRWSLAAGAREFGANHYPLFFILHSGWLLGWLTEAVLQGAQPNPAWHFWLALFAAAQLLRYWCIFSLGRHWNTRILVIPGRKLIKHGPYRFMAHPNYLAVAMELISLPLVFNAWLTALTVTVLNAWVLLRVRIPAEEKALQLMKQ